MGQIKIKSLFKKQISLFLKLKKDQKIKSLIRDSYHLKLN